MADLDGMSLEKFRLWSLSALRSFLSIRKKSTEGEFDDLAARAFITWEENIPVNTSAEHAERQLLKEYTAKLVCGKEVLPDPYSLTSWLDEVEGCEMWPPIYIMDISEYLSSNTSQELVHQLLNEYKVGKGFRYHTSQWVKTIFYHPISKESPICFLKANVTPSMSINAHPYEVWIATEKSSEQVPGGHILSAYCTCTAGMLGTCNHIAGVLFRLEEAAVKGRNQQSVSVTSLPCSWTTPSTKTVIKETDVDKLSWTKDHYTRQIRHPFVQANSLLKKKNFQPFQETTTSISSSEDILNKLKEIAMKHAPESRYLNILQEKRNMTKSKPTKAGIGQVAADFLSNHDNSKLDVDDINNLRQQFIQKINLTDDEIEELKNSTVDQSNSDLWQEQRKGRVTASNFYRVKTRVQTLEEQPDADATAIVGTIMGYKKQGKTKPSLVQPSLRHGLSCEPHAKRAYTLIMKQKHRKFKSRNCGLSVMPCKQYIAASPDFKFLILANS